MKSNQEETKTTEGKKLPPEQEERVKALCNSLCCAHLAEVLILGLRYVEDNIKLRFVAALHAVRHVGNQEPPLRRALEACIFRIARESTEAQDGISAALASSLPYCKMPKD